MPVKVLGFATVREADGLAMSSRNVYLSEDERAQAGALYRSMVRAQALVAGGETDVSAVLEAVRAVIGEAPAAHVEYVQIVDADTLQEVPRIVAPVLLAMAVRVGKARLIDNVTLDPSAAAKQAQHASV